jgi:hypothetical protein
MVFSDLSCRDKQTTAARGSDEEKFSQQADVRMPTEIRSFDQDDK